MSSKNTFLFADIVLPLYLPGTFTYRIPEKLKAKIIFGQRVIVPVKTSKLYTGLVTNLHNNPPLFQLRDIEEILDETPIIHTSHFDFWKWISEYYLCTLGEVFSAALPSVLRPESNSKIKFNFNINKDYLNFEWEHLDEDEQELVKIMSAASEGKNLDELKNIIGKSKLSNLLAKGIFVVDEILKDHEKSAKENFVSLNKKYENEDLLGELINQLEKKNTKQLDLILFYLSLVQKNGSNIGVVAKKKLFQNKTLSPSSYSTLLKNNIFIEEELEVDRLPIKTQKAYNVDFSKEQSSALEEIKNNFQNYSIGLLHGITGSGKTEIYSKLINETLKEGKSALLMLPEIALTQHLLSRLKTILGENVFVYHSRINEQERAEIYKKVFLSSIPFVVVGSRSSVFLPFSNLGLLIIDEEHDPSYKQMEPAPRYQARDAAIYLAHHFKAKILLGTATPSMESLYNYQIGKYFKVDLLNRYGNSILPQIQIVDLLKQRYRQNTPKYLSETLINSIKESVSKKEQVILFQNRRGFSPVLFCESCGWVPYCINCDVALNYHKNISLIRCHYCGYYELPPSNCKSCGSTRISTQGFGTEKIEEDLALILPDLKIARFDLDSTRSKFAYNKIVNDFENGNIDVIVGTQMISKGLDFSNISLVGILSADSLLHFPDFRTYERAFQMMVQVSGRAGRRSKQGKVIIQTNNPKHPIFNYVVDSFEMANFYQWQLDERKQFNYPPFTKLIKIVFQHKEKNDVEIAGFEFAKYLRSIFKENVLGPEFPGINKIRGYYLNQLLLKTPKSNSFSQTKIILQELLKKFLDDSKIKGLRIVLDVDP